MRTIIILLTLLFLMTACSPPDHDNLMKNNNHIGCADDEVNIDGECLTADQNNARLFSAQETPIEIVATQLGNTEGYLVKPQAEGKYPAVLMIHEWWGLNNNIRFMAEVLASQGYVVYAIDLYDGQVAKDSAEAGKLAGAVRNNQAAAKEKLVNAVQELKKLPYVKNEKIASMGWCFGGGQSLNIALSGEQLSGTVIYYGTVTDNREELSIIDWPVLGIFASEDRSITPESVRAFEEQLNALEIKNEVHIYEGVGHAFANPTGNAFAPEETEDAWLKTLAFLEETLKN